MAPRIYWKGYLKLSLVTCPVAMQPATSEGGKLRFHTLNRATGHRVETRWVDSLTGKTVPDDDEVKGYPTGEDSHVVLEDDELAAVALESTRTIDIQTFVPKEEIGWIWYDTPHFLVPDDPVGEEAFGVIRAAMEATGTVGIARLVLHRRERAVMLEPREAGIVLWTLRYGDEVRPATDYFDEKAEKPDKELLPLVSELIARRTKSFDPKMLRDPVQEKLKTIVEARRKGRKPPKAKKDEAPAPPSNVIDIMDALKRSLAAEKTGKR